MICQDLTAFNHNWWCSLERNELTPAGWGTVNSTYSNVTSCQAGFNSLNKIIIF